MGNLSIQHLALPATPKSNPQQAINALPPQRFAIGHPAERQQKAGKHATTSPDSN
jgi:hypothetical protein